MKRKAEESLASNQPIKKNTGKKILELDNNR